MSSSRIRKKSTRSFNGCLTCRRRKVKCTGSIPCRSCTRLNLTCENSFDHSFRNLCNDGGVISRVSSQLNNTNNNVIENSCSPSSRSGESGTHNEYARSQSNREPLGKESSVLVALQDTQPIVENSLGPRNLESGFSEEQTLTRHYENFMRYFYSLKKSGWNYFTFMLPVLKTSMVGIPLKSSLLAWSAFDLAAQKLISPYSAMYHYERASESVNLLLDKGAINSSCSVSLGKTSINGIEIFLLTQLFLCKCDISTGNYPGLLHRVEKFGQWLNKNISTVAPLISPLCCRVVVWITYIGVRIALWKRESCAELLETFSNHDVRTVVLEKSQLYLATCFGSDYPIDEWIEDLEQDMFEYYLQMFDIMNFFAKCARSEKYSLSDLKNDLDLLIEKFNTGDRSTIDQADGKLGRVQYHWLCDKALLNAAVIFYRRLELPNQRTDEQAQNAVKEILSIALKFKKENSNGSSYFTVWPMALLFAGIEVVDEIHLDWILQYLDGMREYSSCSKDIRGLLTKMWEKQQARGTRVDVLEVIESENLQIFS